MKKILLMCLVAIATGSFSKTIFAQEIAPNALMVLYNTDVKMSDGASEPVADYSYYLDMKQKFEQVKDKYSKKDIENKLFRIEIQTEYQRFQALLPVLQKNLAAVEAEGNLGEVNARAAELELCHMYCRVYELFLKELKHDSRMWG